MSQLQPIGRPMAIQTFRSLVPDFLAPSLSSIPASRLQTKQQTSQFSSTPSHLKRTYLSKRMKKREKGGNKDRGVSAMRHTGLRWPLSVSHEPLPQPVGKERFKESTKIEVDENHGLWGFFNEQKEALMSPQEMARRGRPWTVEELRKKSWEDLHRLWWVCAKEQNLTSTSEHERLRTDIGFGRKEALDRMADIRKTQQAIKHALTERWYAFEDARKLALDDPTVDLTGQGPAYEPYKIGAVEEEQDVPLMEEKLVEQVAPAKAAAAAA